MREQGVETLYPSLVERKKMTVKVNGKVEDAAAIMNESRRRFNGSAYSSSLSIYGGTKFLINGGGSNRSSNSLLPAAVVDGGILRGGGAVNYPSSKQLVSSVQSINGKSQAMNELESEEMETSGEADAPGLRRARSSAADEDALPQWGNRKRSRGSRFDSSKHGSSGAANSNHPPVEETAVSRSKFSSVEKRYVAANGNGVEKKHVSSSNGDAFPPKPVSSRWPVLVFKPMAKSNLPGAAAAASTDGQTWRNGNVAAAAAPHRAESGGGASLSRGEARQSSVQQHKANNNAKPDLSCHRQEQQRNGSDGNVRAEGGGTAAHHGDGGGMPKKSSNKAATPAAAAAAAEEKVKAVEFPWPRIALTLTRKEKEEDFMLLRGTKLPQRPKKRPKLVEKTLLYATPGNWLGDLSRGRYEVREKKATKKRPRGLRAMEESMESDSE